MFDNRNFGNIFYRNQNIKSKMKISRITIDVRYVKSNFVHHYGFVLPYPGLRNAGPGR